MFNLNIIKLLYFKNTKLCDSNSEHTVILEYKKTLRIVELILNIHQYT